MQFATVDWLRVYLDGIHSGYGEYAEQLWASRVRTTLELANGDSEDFAAAGISTGFHWKTIKAAAGASLPAAACEHNPSPLRADQFDACRFAHIHFAFSNAALHHLLALLISCPCIMSALHGLCLAA
jgi:hypothetical protein